MNVSTAAPAPRRDRSSDPSGGLLVIVPDKLSTLVAKGECTERYYNPGNLFDTVHLALTNDDRIDADAIQPMVGTAQLAIHNLATSPHFFLRTLGWRRPFIDSWLDAATSLAARTGARLVRCHGADLNLLAAAAIRTRLGIPYAVSLHTRSDQLLNVSTPERLRRRLTTQALSHALANADVAIGVYRDILPYLSRTGVNQPQLAYNVVAPSGLRHKTAYAASRPFRVLSVGRQIPGKDPSRLIAAVSIRDDIELTLVGEGSLHSALQTQAAGSPARERIRFERAWPNEVLCRRLAEFDAFAIHNDYWGIPKTVLEAMLAGLPILVNRPAAGTVPELDETVCAFVEDTPVGWAGGLDALASDAATCERLGRAARARAMRDWAPDVSERRYTEIYRRLLTGAALRERV